MHASFTALRQALGGQRGFLGGVACVADSGDGERTLMSTFALPLRFPGRMPRWSGWAATGAIHAAMLFALASAFAPMPSTMPKPMKISARLLPSTTPPATGATPASIRIELPRPALQLPPVPELPVPPVQIDTGPSIAVATTASRADPPTASAVDAKAANATEARPVPATVVAVAAIATTVPAPAVPMPADSPATWSADHRECSERQTTRHYPAMLRDRGIQGRVVLRVKVDAEGHASEVVVAGGSGWRLLDEAARRVAEACPFIPARRGDQRVSSWVEYPVRFALQASPFQ